MGEPVDTSAEAVRVTNPSYAEYLNSPAGKIITEQREQIVSLQSSLTAAQQRIADLEAQCARVQRDADEARELAAFNKSGWDGSFRQAMLNGAAANTYRKLIEDHNANCQARCGVGDQEAVRCGYRKYFLNSRRRCTECPTYETIDMPDDAAMAAKADDWLTREARQIGLHSPACASFGQNECDCGAKP